MTTTPMPSLLPRVTRTVVPVLVGMLITAGLKAGVTIPEGTATDLVTAAVTGAYYLVAAQLEAHQGAFGWLLGVPAVTAPDVAADADTGETEPLEA